MKKRDHIKVVYKTGRVEELYHGAFEQRKWTLYGHFREMKKAIEEEKKYYSSDNIILRLDDVHQISYESIN